MWGPPILTPTLGVVTTVEWRDAGRGECVFFTTEVTSASSQGGFYVFFSHNAFFWDGFNCLIMTKPREARQWWPEIETIEEQQSFVENGEVWDAVQLPQNAKSTLIIQRVALKGITQSKVNSLNDQTSRISVRLFSYTCTLIFYSTDRVDEWTETASI